MPISDVLRERARSPGAACAAAALLVRLAVTLQSWALNPVVRTPQLDGRYYQRWAVDISGGDVLGTAGIVNSDPFFLNPLYAYVIAPLVALAGEENVLPVLLLQAVLGAATAALAATAADRYFGRLAAWAAGLGVALSTVLVQLDAHLSVSGLAALLVAGVVFSCAPSRASDPPPGRFGGARGPLASGLWLGLGALARPVAPLALPFVAWLHARRAAAAGRSRARAALLVVAGLAVFAAPSLVRNWVVSGEPVLFTAANGANLHLGNNELARSARGMQSPHFRFSPFDMHADARRYAHDRLGRPPTWGEVSSEFRKLALDELFRHPGASLAYYANKARWLLSPAETPSSANLWVDRAFIPRQEGYVSLLWLAVVPTWLLVALGLVGAVVHRRRHDVLCGPVALVAAHALALVLVFPLSHYRSPAVPALAVLAGGALQWGVAAWRERRRRHVALAIVAVGGIVAAGALPPQPRRMRFGGVMTVAYSYKWQQKWDRCEEFARRASEMKQAEIPGSGPLPDAHFLIGLTHIVRAFEAPTPVARRRHLVEAVRQYREGLGAEPADWPSRINLHAALMELGEHEAALREIEVIFDQVRTDPQDPRTWKLPPAHARYGEALVALGREDLARPHFVFALRYGRVPKDRPAERFLPPDLRRPR